MDRSEEEIEKIIAAIREKKPNFFKIDHLSDEEAKEIIKGYKDNEYAALKASTIPKKRHLIPEVVSLELTPFKKRLPKKMDTRILDILKEDFNGELTEREQTIRAAYVKELLQLKHSSEGCSACQLGALKRKYIQLLSDNT